MQASYHLSTFPLELVELIFCALVLNFLCALVLGFRLLSQDSFQIWATSGSGLSRQNRRRQLLILHLPVDDFQELLNSFCSLSERFEKCYNLSSFQFILFLAMCRGHLSALLWYGLHAPAVIWAAAPFHTWKAVHATGPADADHLNFCCRGFLSVLFWLSRLCTPAIFRATASFGT
jgi:hypothetical protein